MSWNKESTGKTWHIQLLVNAYNWRGYHKAVWETFRGSSEPIRIEKSGRLVAVYARVRHGGENNHDYSYFFLPTASKQISLAFLHLYHVHLHIGCQEFAVKLLRKELVLLALDLPISPEIPQNGQRSSQTNSDEVHLFGSEWTKAKGTWPIYYVILCCGNNVSKRETSR